MEEISRFLGIVIKMFYREDPPPHFHIEYGEFRDVFSKGNLLGRVVGLVDLLHNSICSLKWIFLMSLLPNFSTICLHMLSKFDNKSIQKSLIFSSKANYARGLVMEWAVLYQKELLQDR